MKRRWICVQIGAREHFAVPRALESAGLPVTLVTDLWTANPEGPCYVLWDVVRIVWDRCEVYKILKDGPI